MAVPDRAPPDRGSVRRSAVERAAARGRLRAATDDVHRRLHAHPLFRPLIEGDVGHAGYVRLIERLHAFHAPLEAALRAAHARHAAAAPGPAPRPHAGRLRRDLDSLQPRIEVRPLPAAPSPPGREAYLGALYVVEGSRLGARALFRRLDRLFGDRLDGRRFFAPDPGDAAAWRGVCAALERLADDPARVAAAARAARAAFLDLEAVLDGAGVAPPAGAAA